MGPPWAFVPFPLPGVSFPLPPASFPNARRLSAQGPSILPVWKTLSPSTLPQALCGAGTLLACGGEPWGVCREPGRAMQTSGARGPVLRGCR